MSATEVTTSSGAAADQLDARDARVDVRAKFALARMRAGPSDRRADAIRLIRAVNRRQLAGIYGDDLAIAARLASRVGTVRWKLVQPQQDATLVLDVSSPLRQPPTVIFRGDTPDISKSPSRLDSALATASRTFALWLAGRVTPCDPQSVAAPLTTIAPLAFCGAPEPVAEKTVDLIRHPLLYYVWSRGRGTQGTGRASAAFVPTTRGELNPDDCINFDDTRTPVRASLTVPFRFVCSVGAEFSSDGGTTVTATGTGTLISPRHVLTSGHVAAMLTLQGKTGWKIGNDPSRILVVPGRNHAASIKTNRRPRGILEVDHVSLNGQLDDARRRGRLISDAELIQFDYALLTLKASVDPKTYGFWGRAGTEIREVPAGEIVNTPFVLAGYSGDKCRLLPPTGSATAGRLRECFVKTSPAGCGADVVCQLLSDVASTSWQTPGVVLSSPPSNIKAPLAFSLEASVCAGMSGSPIWTRKNGRHLMIGIWAAFLPQLPIACATRIHADMIGELRSWMKRDGVNPAF